MPEQSAGILVYRSRPAGPEFLLAHPGGPFWASRDDGAWSIPKGLIGEGEVALAAAQREFFEEVGQGVEGEFAALTPLRQKSGKIVHAWMVESDLNLDDFHSNLFEMEWPPRSGRIQAFPEIDRVAWLGPGRGAGEGRSWAGHVHPRGDDITGVPIQDDFVVIDGRFSALMLSAMRNITFISPKGGVGKTTAALLLALGLAERGQRVAIIDSDPNKPLVRWAALPDRPELISVHAAPTAPDIRDAAREAQRREPDWVIVDTEGSERGAMVFAALRIRPGADAGFRLAAGPAGNGQGRRHGPGRSAGRAGKVLTHRAVLSRIPAAIKPRMLKSVVSQLHQAEVQILPTALIDKEAFLHPVLHRRRLRTNAVAPRRVWGADAARHNASRYVANTT